VTFLQPHDRILNDTWRRSDGQPAPSTDDYEEHLGAVGIG
jgi:hypothetical protein